MNDYDIDIEDCRKAVLDAEAEIANSVKWHEKMLLRYAEAIIARDKNKS